MHVQVLSDNFSWWMGVRFGGQRYGDDVLLRDAMTNGTRAAASSVPPHNFQPVVLPLSAPIYRQSSLVVILTHAEVYPSGCALYITLRANVVTLDQQRHVGQLVTNYAQEAGEFTVAVVRNGQRQVAQFDTVNSDEPFYRINASGGGQLWRMSYWLAPLPAGSCSLLVHSPLLGIDMAEVGIDPDQLADAALGAEELWPEQTGEHGARFVV